MKTKLQTATLLLILAVFWAASISNSLKAQMFEVALGPISSTLSDSRSVNFFDLNNDGWEDIYVSNGLNGGQKDLLYLNEGTGQMTPVSDMEIVQASNPSDGASFADYTNDGHIDGVVSSWYGAEDLLYLNDGNATLNYNADAGMVVGSFAETAAFGDYNNDGWLDLYVTNSGASKKNFLYKNLKNGKFERVSSHVLIEDAKPSRGAIWGDFNNDQILDLYVANEESSANDLFFGTGNGNFEKASGGIGVLSSKSSMTASWGDIDNDGDFDLFLGNSGYFSPQKNQLFINQGGVFEPLLNDPVTTDNRCTYGSAFGDFDNDGDLDLITANGFCNSDLKNVLYQNEGDGTFTDASDLLTSNFNFCSFGVAWGDVNNDGFLDLMVANCKNDNTSSQKSNTLLINKGNDNNWLKIKLVGLKSNYNAIGAKVKIKATINGVEVWQHRQISAQSGYAGQNSMIAHFGIGDASMIDSLIIDWPAGAKQYLLDINPNQQLTIEENTVNAVSDLNEHLKLSIEAYPNPLSRKSGEFNLLIQNLMGNQKGKLMLYDSLGQMHFLKKINIQEGENKLSIPISPNQLSGGMYQLVVQIGAQQLTRKLTVY